MKQIDLIGQSRIMLSCVRRGRNLRVKVDSEGYRADWFCAFPRGLRREGARYIVERLTAVRGRFYRVSGEIIEVRSMEQRQPVQQQFSMEYDGGTIHGESEEAVREVATMLDASRKRERERDHVFPGHGREKMTALCSKFPTLALAPIRPWDADRFLLWVLSTPQCSGAVHSARFVLSVWNQSTDWVELAKAEAVAVRPQNPQDRVLWDGLQRLRQKARAHLVALDEAASSQAVWKQLSSWFEVLRPFCVVDAFGTWDEEHRNAFRMWAQHPFFP